MTITLTLTNVPDHIYDRLKLAAGTHGRSINDEAITCLETGLSPVRMHADDRIARVRAIRETLQTDFSADDIDDFKREGRN